MSVLQYILWNANPEVLKSIGIDAGFDFRWYGILFASGFFFGQLIISHIFKVEGKPAKDVEAITIYALVATIVGARLGHCLFYEPEYFLKNPIEILKVWNGGLASHGATIGILLGIYLYSKKRPGQSFLWTIDKVVITVALGGALIRMGNLMNSEIVGKPTDSAMGFIFVQPMERTLKANFEDYIQDISVSEIAGAKDTTIKGLTMQPLSLSFKIEKGLLNDSTIKYLVTSQLPLALFGSSETMEHIYIDASKLNPIIEDKQTNYAITLNLYGIPRLPSQLFEAISTFVLFLILFWLWNRQKAKTPEGSLFAIFVIYVFTLRFFYEFSKENQVAFEDGLALNMGQILSIPMIIVGIITLILVYKKKGSSNNI